MTTGVGGPSSTGVGGPGVAGKPVSVQDNSLVTPVPAAVVGADGVVTYEYVSSDAGADATKGAAKVPPKLPAPARVLTGMSLSQLAEKARGADLTNVSDVMLVALLAAARAESEQEKIARSSMAVDKVASFLNLQASANLKRDSANTIMTGAAVGLGLGLAGGITAGILTGISCHSTAKSMGIGMGSVKGSYTEVGGATPGTTPGTAPGSGGVVGHQPAPPPAPPPALPSAPLPPATGSAPGAVSPTPSGVTPPAVTATTPAQGGSGGRPGGGGQGGGASGQTAKEVAAKLQERLAKIDPTGKKDTPEALALGKRIELLNKEVACPGAPDGGTSMQAMADQRAKIEHLENLPETDAAFVSPDKTPKAMKLETINAEKSKLTAMENAFEKDAGVKQLLKDIGVQRGYIDARGSQFSQFAQMVNGFGQTLHSASESFARAGSTIIDSDATHKEVTSRMHESLASSEEANVQSARRAVDSTLQAVQAVFREVTDSFQAVAQNTGR